ncbi:MAG: AEC family transporter, partial [Candidatus Omnitrophica bacterium]|nr:AEC family transporter [Candidatus Omnitrophota bacterium]
MFLESFKITSLAVMQIFLLGAIGFVLVKRSVLGEACLGTISRLAIEVALPAMIFSKLIRNFSFSAYPGWWVFPLMSFGMTAAGFALGALFGGFLKDRTEKLQFMNLAGFQNSGWMPLALTAALLPKAQAEVMFIYLFLFMIGFNLSIFSLGVYTLTCAQGSSFNPRTLLNPPVLATGISMCLIALGWQGFVPETVMKPLEMTGACTLPLALFVVGGNLAVIRIERLRRREMFLLILAKLLLLPAAGLLLVLKLNLPYLVGLLVVIETAVPSATTLSVIIRG